MQRNTQYILLTGLAAAIVLAWWLTGRSQGRTDTTVRPVHGYRGVEAQPELSGLPAEENRHAESDAHPQFQVVRDLASGLGVGQLDLVIGARGTTWRVKTDDLGRVRVPASSHPFETIQTDSETWSICAGLSERDETDIWVYRRVLLRGVVRALGTTASEPPVDGFAVDVVLVGLPGADVFAPSPYPWNREGARVIGEFDQLSARTSTDGSFDLLIPACKGMVARCRAEGWCPAWCDIPVPGVDEREVTVVLDVFQMPILRGRVSMDHGVEAARALVRANVLLRFPAAGFDPNRARLYGESFGSTVEKDGAFLQLVLPIALNKDGGFEVPIPVRDAEILVTTHAPMHAPARAQLPGVRGDVDGIELAPRPDRSGSGVVFLMAGVPASGAHVALTDITDEPFQTLVEFRLDEVGSMPENWLERGRSYWLVISRASPGASGRSGPNDHMDGFLVWNGESSIEVTNLGQDFDAARRGESGR